MIEHARTHPDARIALVGRTAADVRDVMILGESGVMSCSPPWFRPKYVPSRRILTWPNGAQAMTYSADEPNLLRGPQHGFAWCDEVAAWQYPQEAWHEGLMMGLRLGKSPRVVATTTPRPTPLIKQLIKDGDDAATGVRITRGSTFDNRANLPAAFFQQILSQYEGTRLGRQELYAEVLDDAEGALWSQSLIESTRVKALTVGLLRVVVAIDPAVTASETSDETGIVVAGIGADGRIYVLADYSGRLSPNQWARVACEAYQRHKADRIIGEVNNGGALVEINLRTVFRTVPYKAVHAAQGKRTRAEPVAALYEQGRVSHVGVFPKLEDQMSTWEPLHSTRSPDRLDALVWAITELVFAPRSAGYGGLANIPPG